MTQVCNKCGVELNDENWYPSSQKKRDYICKECISYAGKMRYKADPEKYKIKCTKWRKDNPEKKKANDTKWREENREKKNESSRNYTYRHGTKPMNENKDCPVYFGVYFVEGALCNMFDNVTRMPIGNKGYDFVCGNDKKIDSKGACLSKRDNNWHFGINYNTTADYFFLAAFDNREDLNPLHIWLIPGHVLNHLSGTSISPSSLDKWAEYEKPIDEMIVCCNEMKETNK